MNAPAGVTPLEAAARALAVGCEWCDGDGSCFEHTERARAALTAAIEALPDYEGAPDFVGAAIDGECISRAALRRAFGVGVP